MGIKPDEYFLSNDGLEIKNLYDLSNALETMPKDIFNHHVNEERNDFSNWVKEVVGDKELAEKMVSVRTGKTMSRYIQAKLAKRASGREKKQKSKTSAQSRVMPEQKNNEKEIAEKIKHMFAKKKEPVKNKEILKCGFHCPYKNLKGVVIEFLFGMAVGLTIAIILSITL